MLDFFVRSYRRVYSFYLLFVSCVEGCQIRQNSKLISTLTLTRQST